MTKLNLKDIKTGRVRTDGGLEVRIYATDGDEGFPIHGATKCENGWELDIWTREGRYIASDSDHPRDLVLTPQAQYFVIYKHKDDTYPAVSNFVSTIYEAKEVGIDLCNRFDHVKSFEIYKHLNGDVTKV
jgi:hypothetical protein